MTGVPPLADLILYLALGAALGAFYFTLLRRSVRLHAEGAPPIWIAAHYAARIGAAIIVLVLVARAGAWPLLLTFAGFILARLVIVGGGRRRR